MNIRSPLSIFLLFVFLQPVTFAQYGTDIDGETLLPGSSGEPTSFAYPSPFPARGGQVDWGLALSGGGFRSAAFSIGVLKALYEQGIITQIDVISTVSGGGYASYWMYSKYDGKPGTTFGAGAFDDAVFTTNVCNLARKSEFLPLRRMFGGLFSSDDNAFRKYREAIEFTFGADDIKTRDEKRHVGEDPLLPFMAFEQQIKNGNAPYFILNTTIATDHMKGKRGDNIDRSFEITPSYRGSSLLGFADWPDNNPSVKTWCGGVALSAAAIRFKLNRKLPNYSAELPNTQEIKMYDGGFSENLGALPLIQRRMKNIVIVDAENDAAYGFPSYKALKAYLKDDKRKIELKVDDIDTFLDNKERKKLFDAAAVAKGSVKYPDGGESTVYYIKMSRPKTIFTSEMHEKKIWPNGKPLPEAKRSKTRPVACPAAGLTPVTKDSLYDGMVSYSRYINDKWTWRYFFKVFPYINYNFPQLATVDQTYYRDQLEAFIALGYLEASEIEKFKPLN
ncbi:MAG TPA: patatin-like phospholipase family protein [Pyrinomonadaceae bacterium]|nr:patatin-like phospholipase family protein [Pyrinomonadaceae bacterium]